MTTGAAQFFGDSCTSLRPFAITPNKIYLARQAYHGLYLTELRATQSDFYEKDSQMFGVPVAIFGVEPETYGLGKRLKRRLKSSAAGPRLVAARRRLRIATGY